MKKSADPIIQEKESANSAYKQSEMFLRRIGRPVLFSPQKTMLNLQTIFAPVLIGGKDTATLIDGESLKTPHDLNDLGVLELLSCEQLSNSYLRLKYRVIS